MRIGVLTTSYPRSAEDPAGNFVAGLSRYLVRSGHRVEVLAAGEPASGKEPDDGAPGIRVLRIPSDLFYHGGAPDALSAGPRPWAYLSAARFSLGLLRLCAERIAGYQALISHWIVPCGAAGVLAARFAQLVAGRPRVPHLMIAHSSDIHLLRRLHGEFVVRALRRHADLVYTASSLVVPGAPGRVVQMGVDTACFAPVHPGEREEARKRLALHRKTVLFLGRLVPVKGLSVLLRAMDGADHDLLVAGDGPEREHLQALAAPLAKRVRFLGEVSGAARRDLLLCADLLVLPSLILPDGRTEGAPTVVLEALSAGCPVVASDVGGVAALIGDAGLVVPPGDPAQLRAALRQGLAPGWRERKSRQAMEQARHHDWEEVGPRILAGFPIAIRFHPQPILHATLAQEDR